MNCTKVDEKFIASASGKEYAIQDDHSGWFAERSNLASDELVHTVLSDTEFWENDLTLLPGFAAAVRDKYKRLKGGEVKRAIKACLPENILSTR